MEYVKLPDLKSLATLRAVVELGGVEHAARVLCVGQPAVTKRLRGLDACYGEPLMQRTGRRLFLTAAGEQVYAYSTLVLDRQYSLMRELESQRGGKNRLRIEANFSIGDHLLPELLLRFDEAFPQYRVETRMGYTRRIQAHLATGMADLALLEQAPEHPDILVQKWLDDELVLVCGRAHPLWGRGSLSVAELVGLRYVLRESASAMRVSLDKALADVGIAELPTAMEVGATLTIVEMLERGKHVSFLPLFAVADALASGYLFHLRIDGFRIKRTLWIARTRANLDNAAAGAFIQVLRESVRSRNRVLLTSTSSAERCRRALR